MLLVFCFWADEMFSSKMRTGDYDGRNGVTCSLQSFPMLSGLTVMQTRQGGLRSEGEQRGGQAAAAGVEGTEAEQEEDARKGALFSRGRWRRLAWRPVSPLGCLASRTEQ